MRYSATELGELLEVVEKVSWSGSSTAMLTLLLSENRLEFPAGGRRKKAYTE
jgi:hypothetical protein